MSSRQRRFAAGVAALARALTGAATPVATEDHTLAVPQGTTEVAVALSGAVSAAPETGPTSASSIWSGGRQSHIAWQPVIDGERVFMVRQTELGSVPEGFPVVAMDLATSGEAHLPGAANGIAGSGARA